MKIKRLADCNYEEMQELNGPQLKESILKSEGRVIMGQSSTICHAHVSGVTNMEVIAAMGSDMIMLNSYHFTNDKYNPGLCGSSFQRIKELTRNLVGIYLECTDGKAQEASMFIPGADDYMIGRIPSHENVEKALEMGANFIVLGGNPGANTKIETIIDYTRKVKEMVGNRALVMAGKWEDGVNEKVLGDPLARYDAKDVIRQLIEAGADVITLPAPGSRHGITVEMIRQLVEYVHRLGGAALCFLDSSVEGADEETVRQIALMMKQTGADIHAIGDAGYPGMPVPENIYTMSMTIRGRKFTFARMAGRMREKKDSFNYFEY